MFLKEKGINYQTAIIIALFCFLIVALTAETAWSQPNPCDNELNESEIIRHDNDSYCELCGYGYITVIISNGYEGVNMTQMTLVEDLGSSGLTFYGGQPVIVNGTAVTGANPEVTGTNDSILTWTWDPSYPSSIAALEELAYINNNINTLTISFPVTYHNPVQAENLVNTFTNTIQARLLYSTDNECFVGFREVSSDAHNLTLREPDPVVSKQGRNVDAGQTGYSDDVYGNNYDDVIFRIQVTNNGTADLQNLTFDDVMGTGNIKLNYICPNEASAEEVAITNNGAAPTGTECSDISGLANVLSDYDVDDPFGNEPADEVDVEQGQTAEIFLVGKIIASGSCEAVTTNEVSDIRWGCESQSPNGGSITETASKAVNTPPASAYTSMSTYSDPLNDPDITVEYLGINDDDQPAGTKGRVRITIENNTGGTLKNFYLTNTLPDEYVVDPSFTPTIEPHPAYGNDYPGLIDRIAWTNYESGTFPLPTPPYTLPPVADMLLNKKPIFRLYSSTTNSPYADQVNMLRNGDELVVEFGIILVREASYDRTADIDVREEDPSTGTDPDNSVLTTVGITNNLSVDYVDFCAPSTTRNLSFDSTHYPDPEDLDIDIYNPNELIFILTNTQRLDLRVDLTNNGDHDAEHYYAYVTFGQTMDVVTVPAGCSQTTNPPAHREWQYPESIPQLPAEPLVYECSDGTIAPGDTHSFTFQVVKSTDPTNILADDLTFRADVTGEITLFDNTPLWFPASVARSDGITDPANTYSVDGIRARVVGFNLLKTQAGTCSENPPSALPDLFVQIGEECSYHIETGGWFGFQTPGFAYIAVQNIEVVDQLPDGQGYLSSGDSVPPSTGGIGGVVVESSNTGSLQVLDEADIEWTLNDDTHRIDTLDKWFRQDVRTRILNDPASSGLPNRHAAWSINTLVSTFEAVFEDSLGNEEIFTLEPINTVGYPILAVRQISLRVTEPNIIVVKEVCNESLNGVGPTCSQFLPEVNDGDAYDNYIYRIALTNEASSGNVARAPAYDVTVTDTLDDSDYAYVLPFDSDGLDNDADSDIDGLDSDSEGSITDNTPKNLNPGVITFSYNNSSALERIDPGETVYLYYRVNYDDDAAPMQEFTNGVRTAYDSLEGDSGNQSSPEGDNGDLGGARLYNTPELTEDPVEAIVRVRPVVTQPKEILALSNTPLAGSGTQKVVVGEEIQYQLRTLLPVARLKEFIIKDELPVGMSCVEAQEVNLSDPPYSAAGFDPGGTFLPYACEGRNVEWRFGDQRLTKGTAGNLYDFKISFIARVDNTAGNNDTVELSNGDPATTATATYYDEDNTLVTLNFGRVDVVVSEPLIELTKSFAVAEADAADVLIVTVTATNTGTATAYNLRVLEDLIGTNMTYAGNVGGDNKPDIVDTTTLGINRPIFSWNAPNGIDVVGNNKISFTFEVSIDNNVQPLEILDNTIQADWTSLPSREQVLHNGGIGTIGFDGDPDGMRIGALPNAGDPVNDYEATTGAQVTVPALTFEKTDLDPSVVPAIGEHKSFQIDIHLPEGITENLRVSDNLNAAGLSYILENNTTWDITYTFQGISTVNEKTTLDETALIAFPPDGASGSVTWDFGTVVTRTEDDTIVNAIDPMIRIQYHARVNNDTDTDSGDTLQNGATAIYRNGETGDDETLTDDTPLITVTEPILTTTKTVTNTTNPGNPPEGGDILEYVVAINNSGTSTAFDVNVVDTMQATLTYYTGFTPTALIGGSAVPGFVSTPANTPAGPLVWGRDNGDESLDIPAGSSLVLTYQTVVTANGGNISNSAMVDWTSLDGTSSLERTGDGCPNTTAPNDYCAGPAVATVATVDTTSINKTVSSETFDTAPWSTTTDAVVRVGDLVTYRLGINLTGGLTQSIEVQDQLPGGMEFVGTISINGDTTADYTAPASGPGSNFSYAPITSDAVPAAGQTGTLAWTIGDVNNDPFGDPISDTIEILYLARIKPDAGISQVASTPLTNTVTMNYATATGPAAPQTDSVSLTLVQPILAVTKTAVAEGGDTVLAAEELVTYTIDITNSGDGPAYDTNLTDIIPVGMRNGTAPVKIVRMELPPGTALPLITPVYDAATGLMTLELDTGVADQYTIPAHDTLRIVYQIQADADLGAGMTMTNQAQVQNYQSLDDDAIPAQGGATGEAQVYGPTNTDSVTFTTDAPDSLIKENPPQTTASIGELFSYRITVPETPQVTVLHDVRIVDDLSASAADMSFVSVTKISGSQPWTPVNTGTATNVIIEDTDIGIDIPAGEQIIIEITVMIDDTSANVNGLLFHNTADYTYNQISGDPVTRMPGGSDTTPDLTIVSADTLVVEKTGPTIVQMAVPATYTLNFHNTSTGTIWNPTLTDQLPDIENGGMCGTGPSNVTAQVFLSDGVTAVSPVLTEDTDYTVVFDSDTCEWTFNLLSSAGGVPADNRLIVTYELSLDPDTENGISLTNIAGATLWYSADPDVSGSTPRTYVRTLSDGTPGTEDHEDAHTVTAEAPVLQFEMSVINVTTGEDPGANASPGDTLRYTIEVTNSGPVGLSGFSIVDQLDALNTTPLFAPGTLNLITVPTGADTSATDAAGGTNGTGLVNIANLNLGADGDPDNTLVIVYEVDLAPVITSGTTVLNQAELVSENPNQILSDDPNLEGDRDPTETMITSAPQFQILKTSTFLEGDPNILMAGETVRYTLTIKNIGDENAVNAYLRDSIPANTTYVPNSTTLNGNAVPDPSAGVSPLQDGMPINTPEDSTAGYMRADTDEGAANVATITFDVVVDPAAMDGLIIANQGFVGGDGAGSGTQPEQPSDDPDTEIADDPTQDVVGNVPLLYAYKTVEIYEDLGSPGIVDPGDVLRYTINISNSGAIPATGVVLTDTVPPDTTYVADSLRLNDALLGSDGGVLPLIAGLSVQSGDNPGDGIISPGQSAVVTFETTVNAGVATGTVISNQGSVSSEELPDEPTDSDGVAANGNQPTLIVVGAAQLLTITKEVSVAGSGAAMAGGELEYVIRVSNIGSLPAIQVNVTDDLNPPLGDQVTYVDGSGTLNGAAVGIDFTGGVLTADYASIYGDLEPGDTAILRFRVQIDSGLEMGSTITNTGVVSWNNPVQNDSASISIDVGGTPGSAVLNGNVWHDVNFNLGIDTGAETPMEEWTVELYYNGTLVTTVLTDAGGGYAFSGLLPNQGSSEIYELRFLAPGAGLHTASMGMTDSPFTNGPQRISDIVVASGSNLQNLNLPLWPNGTVYNSVVRTPVPNARLTLLNGATGQPVPEACFDDPVQQNQVTIVNGFYKFDLNFSQSECQAGDTYIIDVTEPSTGYEPVPSAIIPPTSDTGTAPFSIPTCPASADDAVPITTEFCEASTSAAIPSVDVPPNSPETVYYLNLVLDDSLVPGHSQIFNNLIPIDPELEGAVAITKTAALTNVTRSTMVPYTITVTNIFGVPLYDTDIVDRFPPGFKYLAGSARMNGEAVEPQFNNNELTWEDLDLQVNQVVTLKLLLVVGSGVSEGEYVNRAWVINPAMEAIISGEATATVRVIPDPDFDCTDVIGKVFDDQNLNGYQDENEKGLADVRLATLKGLNAATDEFGRFHFTCAAIPDEDQGSNFLLKLDERTLPTGYRLTTENPRVQRATRGKMIRFNFGATIHRVVRMDISDAVFEPDTSDLRPQWIPRIDQLMEELQKAPSILRLSYLGDVEKESDAEKRLQALEKEISSRWNEMDKSYTLVIETELFWRRGGPEGGKR